MKKCPYCAEQIQNEAVVCRYCGRDLPTSPTAGSGGKSEKFAPSTGDFNLSDPIRSFADVTRRVVLKPAEFFAEIPQRGNFTGPMLFAMIATAIVIIASLLLGLGELTSTTVVISIVQIIISPLLYLLSAAIFHPFVRWIVGPGNSGFEATFRAIAYSSTTPLLAVLWTSWQEDAPILLLLLSLASFYALYLLVVGIRELHGTTMGKAVLSIVGAEAGLIAGIVLVSIVLTIVLSPLIGTSPQPDNRQASAPVQQRDASDNDPFADDFSSTSTGGPHEGKNSDGENVNFEENLRAAVTSYYEAVDRQDWNYTYDNLDSQTKRKYSRDEYVQKNRYLASVDPVAQSSPRIASEVSTSSPVEVVLNQTFVSGATKSRVTYFVWENGAWKHRFSQQDDAIFLPNASYNEFVTAKKSGA